MTEVLLAAVTASLLGSFHCVGMCGGFVAFYAGDAGAQRGTAMLPHLTYNAGRLLTYVVLGALAGSLGAAINLASAPAGVRGLAALVSGGLIVAWGLVLLVQALGKGHGWVSPSPTWLNRLLSKFLPRLMDKPPVFRALALGMASTLLPCGWLYGFAVTAAGTGSPAYGALFMAAFWLGTVPAMLGAGLGVQRLAHFIGPKLGIIMPVALVVMGILTVTQRGIPMVMENSNGISAFEGAPPGEVQSECH
ncbi:MAG: sulfite exporter TauE/SafE family protein [Myxococcota bacterium]